MAVREKITLQEIADMVGVSRNTVSKIVNGRYTGSAQIRNRVITVLRENNYKGLGQVEEAEERDGVKTLLLLCNGEMDQSNFFLPLVNEIQQNVESRGYVLVFYGVLQEEMERQQLPQMVEEDKVDGIVCIELYHRAYIEKLLRCGIPTVFLEFCRDLWDVPGRYDVVLMNNEYPAHRLTAGLLENGCKRIGFVGNARLCRGNYERYRGYGSAMREYGLSPENACCLEDAELDRGNPEERLREFLDSLRELPDAFVAASDKIALALLAVLKERGVQVPRQVQIVSFDNLREGAVVDPPLTTVGSDREELVQNVIGCLMQRMASPGRARNVIYVDSRIIYRKTSLIQS